VEDDLSAVTALPLPAFELDCRDWLVATPADGSVPEEIAGSPVIAILSTVLITGIAGASTSASAPGSTGTPGSEVAPRFAPASAVFSVGLSDEPMATVRSGGHPPIAELIDFDVVAGTARYVVPAPSSRLALLAEFACAGSAEPELLARFHALMSSFRWAS
jgi:hypothetical protein